MNITLDPITKRFTQVEPQEKVCYVCGGNKYVDDHHIDCQEGRISPKTVPLCRRCHRTYHNYGVEWFEDEYLDRIIEVENRRREIVNKVHGYLPPMKRGDVKRSNYWNKKHGIKTTTKENNNGSRPPPLPFHLSHGEPLCDWEWVSEHLYDLSDYVPRIEIIHPDLHLSVDIDNAKKLKELGKTLRGLRGKEHKVKEVITLDPETKRFSKEVI